MRKKTYFGEKTILWKKFSDFRRKNDVPVFESVIEVFLGVLDLTHFSLRDVKP
jgi:hypothetical protein